MRKSTLLIMTATIAAIITTSVLGFALPNQVFAQSSMQIFVRNGMGLGQTLAGHEAQAGKVLSGQEAEVAKIIPGKLDVLFPTGGPIKP